MAKATFEVFRNKKTGSVFPLDIGSAVYNRVTGPDWADYERVEDEKPAKAEKAEKAEKPTKAEKAEKPTKAEKEPVKVAEPVEPDAAE